MFSEEPNVDEIVADRQVRPVLFENAERAEGRPLLTDE
jgi:hypothetical protein